MKKVFSFLLALVGFAAVYILTKVGLDPEFAPKHMVATTWDKVMFWAFTLGAAGGYLILGIIAVIRLLTRTLNVQTIIRKPVIFAPFLVSMAIFIAGICYHFIF
jgi:predicted cobalt transporter CbtA